MEIVTGKKLITASELVCDGACLLYGFLINSDDAGDFVDFYGGQDTGSGEKFIHTHTRENAPDGVFLTRPLKMNNGLYVVLDDGIQNVTVFYNPLRSLVSEKTLVVEE